MGMTRRGMEIGKKGEREENKKTRQREGVNMEKWQGENRKNSKM